MPDTPSMSEMMKTRMRRLLYALGETSDLDERRTARTIESLEGHDSLHLAVCHDREPLLVERRQREDLRLVLFFADEAVDLHRDLELVVVNLDVDRNHQPPVLPRVLAEVEL